MAFMSDTRPGTAELKPRFATLIEGVKARMERRRSYRTTLRELMALSNRELADLGLHRSMLRGIAKEAAYDNRV